MSGLLLICNVQHSINSCQATVIKKQWVCFPELPSLVTSLPTIFWVKDMAKGLSCITTVKNQTRQPSVWVQETQSQSRQIHLGRICEDPKRLYTIEIVKEEDYWANVHYVGYSSRYGEWIRRSSIVLQAPKPIETEPELLLLHTQACNIK